MWGISFKGIVRLLLVLSTFVLGGGGGSVTIGQCCLFVWATVVGIGISYVIVHSRWIKVAYEPHVIAGSRQTGGEPCGDR